MQTEDQKAPAIVSALVLVAAALFTANVYMTYVADRNVAIFEDAENSYDQAAATFLSLRATQADLASSTDNVVVEDEATVIPEVLN